MAAQRPTRPAIDKKLMGREVLVFLDYGEGATYDNPVWSLIGGQRSADFNNSADAIDTSDKNSNGYGDSEPGLKTTEISMELIIKPSDPTIGQLYDAYENNEAVDILRWVKGGRSTRNWYSITDMSESAAYDDASILSLTLTGKGEPKVIDSMADPRQGA
ncbi:phage tail tube protein [Phascolarctobacterium faecium]|uniref:phage tail tube protein n=1 Tax=Phascolarctobacterium faecium TaxID=33025 RepID=UPI003FEFD1DB